MLELKQIESFYPESLRPFKRNLLREYLQYKILEVIYSSAHAEEMSFMGGTAIHIVYGLARFSEDLDFDNRGLHKKAFQNLSALIQKKLKLQGYTAEVKNSFKGAFRAYIRIGDILYESKLSAHKQEKMLIQLDAEPQGFSYKPDKIILNKFDVLTRINVVPLDILLSQKLVAIFMRKRPMGRDFYDALFLFGRTRPNYDYLKAKLNISTHAQLQEHLLNRCRRFNFKQLAKNVEQFLFVPNEAKKILLFPEVVTKPDLT